MKKTICVGVFGMTLFGKGRTNLSYKDVLQVDGAFSTAHINYDKSPLFNGSDSRNLAKASRRKSPSAKDRIDDVQDCLKSFDGTENNLKRNDRISLWENYWMEYINAFDTLRETLPNSIATINVGRQAVEIGFKYLLLKKTGNISYTHNLQELSVLLFKEYKINDSYMEGLDVFCEKYSKYIEGENVEYFRFPEYKKGDFFAGNRLDIEWLSYNFALILLKLLHFANQR